MPGCNIHVLISSVLHGTSFAVKWMSENRINYITLLDVILHRCVVKGLSCEALYHVIFSILILLLHRFCVLRYKELHSVWETFS